jgi:hypothetical protein
MKKSLDEALSERIIDAISKTGEYSREGLEKHITKKFAKGSLTQEDWKLFAELEISKDDTNEQKN